MWDSTATFATFATFATSEEVAEEVIVGQNVVLYSKNYNLSHDQMSLRSQTVW